MDINTDIMYQRAKPLGFFCCAVKSSRVISQVSFDLHPHANPASREQQLKRFQPNPERNWGPKTRAAAGTFRDSDKRIRNQGKKRKKRGGDEVTEGMEEGSSEGGDEDAEEEEVKKPKESR